jgi:hypothetical protein
MSWRTYAEGTLNWLWARAASWAQELVREIQEEWRSRPLIRHLSALALCLFVVLVGVLERSTNRASMAAAMTSVGRTVAAPQMSPRGVPVARRADGGSQSR